MNEQGSMAILYIFEEYGILKKNTNIKLKLSTEISASDFTSVLENVKLDCFSLTWKLKYNRIMLNSICLIICF